MLWLKKKKVSLSCRLAQSYPKSNFFFPLSHNNKLMLLAFHKIQHNKRLSCCCYCILLIRYDITNGKSSYIWSLKKERLKIQTEKLTRVSKRKHRGLKIRHHLLVAVQGIKILGRMPLEEVAKNSWHVPSVAPVQTVSGRTLGEK